MAVAEKKPLPDFAAARRNMIESQIRPNKVRDERVLTAMETVPREAFVPEFLKGIAYVDEDLEIKKGRYLLEPMILARLLEEGHIKASDKVLDVAPATGYSTAILARLAETVVGLECDPELQAQAVNNIGFLSLKNVDVRVGKLSQGYDNNAPYDVIIINGSVDEIPAALFAQLAESGRLLAVIRRYGPANAAHTGEARLYTKTKGQISSCALFDANVKPLLEFSAKAAFTF